jgi:hypothetical protein
LWETISYYVILSDYTGNHTLICSKLENGW